MSVAEHSRNRRQGLWKRVVSIFCSVTIAVAAMIAVPTKSEAAINVSGNDIIRTAVSYLGTPYVLGGTSKEGLDCSGFVYLVLTQLGYSNVPRTSAGWLSAPALTWNGEKVNVQTLDPTNSSYDAQPGDILVYQGHVGFCMGRPGTWGQYSSIRSYTAAMGGNTKFVFDTYSQWPNTSPWYRIHARSASPNAQGRIRGVEIDDTNYSAEGCYAIRAYRITSSSGANTGSSSKKPEITDISISNVTSKGYTVTATFSNTSSIQSILLPTWTSANGQDDITWDSVKVSEKITYEVKTSAHKNESGEYNTHIHMQDKSGNTTIAGKAVNVPASNHTNNGKASIASVEYSDVDSSGYTVIAKITNPSAAASIQFPTWTSANGQDDIIWDQAPVKDTVTYRVDTSKHGNKSGIYNTHVYLNDKSGNVSLVGITVGVPGTSNNQKPQVSGFNVSNVSASGYDVTVTIQNAQNISYVVFPTWTSTNGQDDITWGEGKVSGNTYTYHVNTSDHGKQKGIYNTHIHIYDKNGNLIIDGREIIVP